jgi:protein-tyrosine phosphatase
MVARSIPSMLFVCTGNICRSPIAEGVFRHLAERNGHPAARFDSAGLGHWHVGEPPDRRAITIAGRHGIFIGDQVCRQFSQADFARFDVILGMDSGHVTALQRLKPDGSTAKVALFSQFCVGTKADVPDPYYGTPDDYERVYGMIRAAGEAWFETMGSASSGQASSTI